MKTKIILILSIVIAALIGMSIKTCSSYKSIQKDYEVAMANNKAYQQQLDTVSNNSRVFQFKVEQLQYFNDSITKKMRQVQADLKIKDKNLREMYYIASKATKSDTIVLKGDTIFKDQSVKIDTVVGDKWYNINVKLQYPSAIITIPTFASEKYIVASTKKEYIKPPSKWWIVRLFQKKQEIITVDVIEKNPYVTNQQNRFIQIIK